MEEQPKTRKRPIEYYAESGLKNLESATAEQFPRRVVHRLIWNVRQAREVAEERLERLSKRVDTAELLDRKLPSDFLSEGIVLGTVIINPETIKTLKLTPAHFLEEGYRKMFEVMLSLRDRDIPVDGKHLIEELKQTGQWEFVGAAGCMAELMMMTMPRERFQEYCRRLEDRYRRRKVFYLALEMIKAVHSDAMTDTVIEKTKRTIETL